MLCFPFFELSTKLNRSKVALLATREPGLATSCCTDASSRALQEFLCNRRKGVGTSPHVFPRFIVEGRDSVSPGMFSVSCDVRWTLSCSQWVLSFQIEVLAYNVNTKFTSLPGGAKSDLRCFSFTFMKS